MSEFISKNKKRIAVLGAAAGAFGVAGAVEAPAALAASKYEVKAILANDGKVRPGNSYFFKAGTKIFRSPSADAAVYERVPAGQQLFVEPGPTNIDARGNHYIGFSLQPQLVHDINSAADQEMWMRMGQGAVYPSSKEVTLHVHDNGHITASDGSLVNRAAFETTHPPHVSVQ